MGCGSKEVEGKKVSHTSTYLQLLHPSLSDNQLKQLLAGDIISPHSGQPL